MNVSLTPQLEQMIHDKVESGLFSSASEVVREALRIMIHQESHKAMLDAALAEGIASLDRGERVVLTDAEWERIMAEARSLPDDAPLDPLVTGEFPGE